MCAHWNKDGRISGLDRKSMARRVDAERRHQFGIVRVETFTTIVLSCSDKYHLVSSCAYCRTMTVVTIKWLNSLLNPLKVCHRKMHGQQCVSSVWVQERYQYFLLLRNSLHRGRAPTARADSTCRLMREHEADWRSIGCWKTLDVLLFFFFSLLEVMTGRGELTECSKLTCFAKRMLDMVPGDSGKWDRRSLSATVRDCRRTFQVESELGKGKNRPNTTYPSSKEEEKAILNARIQIHERVKEPNWGRCSIDELLCACMHALRAAAELQCMHTHALLALSWAWVTTVSSCSSK